MKTETDNRNYRPQKNGFPYKLLKYLLENGRSKGIDIQREIGLNKWADRKGAIYYERASSNFDHIVYNLVNRGLVLCLPDDEYELTKEGKLFTSCYKVR